MNTFASTGVLKNSAAINYRHNRGPTIKQFSLDGSLPGCHQSPELSLMSKSSWSNSGLSEINGGTSCMLCTETGNCVTSHLPAISLALTTLDLLNDCFIANINNLILLPINFIFEQ